MCQQTWYDVLDEGEPSAAHDGDGPARPPSFDDERHPQSCLCGENLVVTTTPATDDRTLDGGTDLHSSAGGGN